MRREKEWEKRRLLKAMCSQEGRERERGKRENRMVRGEKEECECFSSGEKTVEIVKGDCLSRVCAREELG